MRVFRWIAWVCGDVGFGKTAGRLRAAFRRRRRQQAGGCVVPDHAAAEQHMQTFRHDRLLMPVQIAELSRFRSSKEITQIVAGINARHDRHRDRYPQASTESINFERLGLVIIDENHRSVCGRKSSSKRCAPKSMCDH